MYTDYLTIFLTSFNVSHRWFSKSKPCAPIVPTLLPIIDISIVKMRSTIWLFQFGGLCLGLVCVSSVVAKPRIWGSPNTRQGIPLRGGDTDTDITVSEINRHVAVTDGDNTTLPVRTPSQTASDPTLSSYVAVSLLVMDNDTGPSSSNLSSGCMLFPRHTADSVTEYNDDVPYEPFWSQRLAFDSSSNNESTNLAALYESVAATSDIVLLVLRWDSPIDPILVQALRKGWHRRTVPDAGLPKAQLLVICTSSGEFDTVAMTAWRERMALHDLASLSPSLLQSMELILPSDTPRILQQAIRDANSGVTDWLAPEGFPQLLQQAYNNLGGSVQSLFADDVGMPRILSNTAMLESSRPSSGHPPPATDRHEQSAPSVQQIKSQTDGQLQTALIAEAYQELEVIQTAQEEHLLDTNTIPFDFGGKCGPFLERLRDGLEALPDEASRSTVQQEVGERLRELFHQQLQAWRDHYGRVYEALLDRHAPETWSMHASHVTQSFRNAAQESVPVLARANEVFRDMDLEYIPALQGLVSDMMEATTLRQSEVEEDGDEENGNDTDVEARPKRVARWYEKLAARALVLGVNYLQGWLAWQGIQRAALQRERNMPKFPLF